MLSTLKEILNGLLATLIVCLIIGTVLAVIMFGGVFLTVAGVLVGGFVIFILLVAGFKEWLDSLDSR